MWCNCSCFRHAHERDLSATPRFSFCTRFFFCLSVMARLASAVFVFALSILCVSVSPAAALGFLSVQAAKMLGGSNASHTALAGVEAVGYNHVMGTYTSSNYMCRAPTSNRDGLLLGTATSENPTTGGRGAGGPPCVPSVGGPPRGGVPQPIYYLLFTYTYHALLPASTATFALFAVPVMPPWICCQRVLRQQLLVV